MNESLKKPHKYIYLVYHWLGIPRFTAPLGAKGNNKFEMLLIKMFSLKQKTKNAILPAAKEKNQIFTLKENNPQFL